MRPIDADAVYPWYIKAFSQEEMGDRAIKPNDPRFSMNDIKGNLDNIPTLTQEPKWILVSERLPEEKDYCLCCDKDGNMTIGFISKYSKKKWVFDDDEVDMDVTAWMPLPQPYKAETEEKNVGED